MDEDCQDAEEQSMMKFAAFLERRGFITKMNQGGGDIDEVCLPTKRAKKDNQPRRKQPEGNELIPLPVQESNSEETVYTHAVKLIDNNNSDDVNDKELNDRELNKRNSSSLEENLGFTPESSPELGVDKMTGRSKQELLMYQKFLDCRLQEERSRKRKFKRKDEDSPSQPGLSRVFEDSQLRMEEKTRQMIRKAEASKAKAMDVSGEHTSSVIKGSPKNLLFHSVIADEDYMVLGSHIDEGTKDKIAAGMYVDFAKLLPRDRLVVEEDHRLEIVSRNGQTFFQPMEKR